MHESSPKWLRGDTKVKTEKMMAVFAALLMVLSMVGFVYAAWYDNVQMEAEIHMGELIVGWYGPDYLVVEETTNGFPEDEPGHGFEPKPWVANTTVTFEEPETSVHHDPPETVYKGMVIFVENAYPQYDVHIDARLKNAGNIPACLYQVFKVTGYDPIDGQDLGFVVTGEGYDGSVHWMEGAVTDPVVGRIINFVFKIHIPDPDKQMEPCTDYLVEIDVDFKQEAEECHTYEFEVRMLAIQWNKLYEAPNIPF